MLAPHLLQSALVHVNTLLMQGALADPKWADKPGGQPESDGEPRAKPGAFAGVLIGVETFDDDVGEVRRELLAGLGARSLTGQSVGIDGLAEPVAFGGGDGAASEPVGPAVRSGG
ncbi:transposase [Nonomuraea terrae]|uniref:transposase n=1 Tax=Nonomuraea terrae TaxID=2530383 RepID=UPI001404FE91|nr:transposase [Nonomuraea terrae]